MIVGNTPRAGDGQTLPNRQPLIRRLFSDRIPPDPDQHLPVVRYRGRIYRQADRDGGFWHDITEAEGDQ